MLAPNTLLQNRYRIVRQLGQGGMGTVYEAIDDRVTCVVAIKETHATSDSETRRAFEREAALLANLRHPLLPKVMDHFSEGDGQFLVMEFIYGYDLAALLQERGSPFAVEQVLGWADELLKVLEYLHGRQPPILHRDIKPSNLKLTKQNEIFVLDFGLAKGAAGQMPTLVTSHSVRGYTPVYSPLEQIYGKGTDPRSDIYSLGATLYHLLTATQPIDAPTRFADVEDDKPDPLRTIDVINPDVSRQIAAVIHKAMAISRKHRHASASLLRSALREAQVETNRQEEIRRPNKPRAESDQAKVASRLRAEPDVQQAVDDDQNKHDVNKAKAAQDFIAPTQPSKDADSQYEREKKALTGRPAQMRQHEDGMNASRAGTKSNAGEEGGRKGSNRVLVAAVVAVLGIVVILAFGVKVLLQRANLGDDSQQGNDAPQTTSQPTKAEVTNSPPAKATSAGKPFRNSKGIEMVWVLPGSFEMGSNSGSADEKPVHRVTISEGFFMGKYEVTQAQWQDVMRTNPSYFKGDDSLPVEQVSWNDAHEFINKLNETNDGYKYRLPTEAEWEYACRAGTTGDYYAADVDGIGWYADNSGKKTHAVGGKQPNAFGLYDMSGNVSEWCQDWYVDTYNGALADGSARLSGDEQITPVLRGGAWFFNAPDLRCANRNYEFPGSRYTYVGFRVVALVRTQ